MARLAEICVPGDPDAWRAIGFHVDPAGLLALANGAVRIGVGPALAVVDLPEPTDVDGVRLEPGSITPARDHPNGASDLDHVVITTDSLERTSAAVAGVLGLPQRRIRELGDVRQAFHRFAPSAGGVAGCILELVQTGRTSGTNLFGLVITVTDLAAVCAQLGPDVIGQPKPAVQPGRQIATVRTAARLGMPVALMTPP